MELRVETYPSPKGVRVKYPKTVFAVPSEKDGVFVFLNRGDLRAAHSLQIKGLTESEIESIQTGEELDIVQSDPRHPNVHKMVDGCLIRAVAKIGMPNSFSVQEVLVQEFTEFAPTSIAAPEPAHT